MISGGVDSAVAVHRICEMGYKPDLFYIKIGMEGEGLSCTAEEDIELSTATARRYGLHLEVVDLQKQYWELVVGYAMERARRGLTPNPDVMCNKLGDLMKEEVRHIADTQRLPSAKRRDSQGICFLGQIDYNDFVRRFLGEREGAVIEIETGRRIGTHKGYWFHTIGQRKGLGLGGGPWFVVKKDVEQNILYVSHGYDTLLQYGHSFNLKDFHFITENPWGDAPEVDVTFKTRHQPHFMKGRLHRAGHGYRLESPERIQGIAPGQFGVVYDAAAEICIGSGEIGV